MNVTSPTADISMADHVSLGSFTDYRDAQQMVDYLAQHDFEVATTRIVGTDLRMIEQVTGRLTWPRAIASGVGSGAWFGLFVGLLLSLLSTVTLGRALVFGVFWGVVFGAVFAAVGYALTRGRRDFTSLSITVPSRFEVFVADGHATRANAVLAAAPVTFPARSTS